MLTNNKKNFVRSIAMLLVLLMVVAMGLTACGNKNAITEETDPTVADKLSAALADYIKKDDEATVKAIVEKVLGEEGISAEKVATLTNALESYITADDAKKLITDEVAKIALDDAMTKDDVLKILKDYYTKKEIDDKLKSYFGDFTAAQVHTMLKDVDKAMNLEDWNKASDVVIATIESMQDLLEAVENDIYTQVNMAKVNELLKPLSVVPFTKKGTDTKLTKPADMAEFEKLLEYRILRVATLEEVEELKAAVDAALAVPTFASELKALENALYALGENVVYGSYTGTNNAFVAEKWAAKGTYHNVEFAKDAQKVTQVVTLNDKADFYAWNKSFDNLYATYYADGALAGTYYTIYRKDTTTTVNNQTVVTTDLKLELGTPTTAPSGYTKVGTTIINDVQYLRYVLGIDALAASVVLDIDDTTITGQLTNKGNTFAKNNANHVAQTDWKATGKYGYEADPYTFSDVNTTLINTDELSAAYSSIVAQLKFCQAAANTANTVFDAFQLNSIYGSAEKTALDVFGTGTSKVKYENVTDAQLLAALTASMCEAGGVAYNPYLTDVTTVMDISKVVNGKTTTGINEYELYEKMISKAYDLLWDKYKVAANKTAAAMLKDYISLVYEATSSYAGNGVAKQGQANANPLPAKTAAELAALMVAGGENTVESDLTAGFVAAYLNGTADGKLAGTFYEKLGKNFNATRFVDYYANNGKAVKITTVAGANMTYGTYNANPLFSLNANAADIAQRLTGSMLSVSLKINSASKDEMKASGVAVEKAFDGFLKEGIANLDEIIARFTIEDYKAKTYNDMIVKINNIFNYYGANANAVAAMQQYLMGVNDAKAFGGTITYTAANVTTVKSWTFGKNALEDTLTNAQLLTNVSAVSVNPYATSNGVETVKVAEAAQKQINDAAAAATAVIENVAIKVNFLNYLEAARMEWLNIYRQYTAKVEALAPQNFELKLRMSMLSSEVDDTITVIKYYAEQDGIELKNYKANYLEILSMIGAQTNKHLALLQGKTIDEVLADTANTLGAKTYTDSAAKVLSTYQLVVNSSKTESWVTTVVGTMNSNGVVKIDPLTHVGTAVVDLDKLANENTEIKTVAGSTTTTRKLYN